MKNKPAILLLLGGLLLSSSIFGIQKDKLSERFQKWLDEEVVYIISPLEKDVFLQLTNDRDRDLFIAAFWKQRDPTKGTPENEFKTEHFQRINYANRYLGRTAPKPGWRTDRGRVHIILGLPNDIQRFEGKTQIYNTEVWFYQGLTDKGLPAGFNVVFYQKGGTGEYELYSPLQDGPQALLTSYYGDPMDYLAAYEQLREFEPELAPVSLSLIPGEGDVSMGRPTMSSDILIQRVESTPARLLQEKYARKFLEYKDTVEVEYSVNYMDSYSSVAVLREPSGLYYIHYSFEPDRLSLNQFEDKYYTTLKLNGSLTDREGKLIYQFEKDVSLEFNGEQIKNISSRPVSIRDVFPMISGQYRLSVLVKNEVSKEFTSLERDILIPGDENPLQMTTLLMGHNMKRTAPTQDRLRPFQVGPFQMYSHANRVFLNKDVLHLAFQVYGINAEMMERGEISYTFKREDEVFRSLTRPVKDNPERPHYVESFSLTDFPPAHYSVEVVLQLDGGAVLSQSDEFDITHMLTINRPWYFNKMMPGPADPLHPFLIGTQLYNSGRHSDALPYLKESYGKKSDSLDYALSLAKCYFQLASFKDVVPLLKPFLEDPELHNYEMYLLSGQAYQRLGDLANAIEVLDRAVNKFGINTPLLNTLGNCYFRLGQTAEARAAWEKSLEIDADQPQIKKYLEEIKKKR
ncbi:GWxTD domain-containing protein [Acidobacteriota bacterium]